VFTISKSNREDDFSLLLINDDYSGMLYNCRIIDNFIFVLFIYLPDNYKDRLFFTGLLSDLNTSKMSQLVLDEINNYKQHINH